MIGQTISHYKILEKLGEGGMGVVYKAHDTKLQREVALKFLPHYITSDSAEKERFYHEARAASALNHPNVTTIYDINEFENPATLDKQLYLAMEYVEGKTLKQLVEKEVLPIKKVLDIAIQICDGLAAAQEKGIVHRDIKSENIMLTPKGQVKIMDFGLAKVKGATKLTKEGSTLGTAAYMSPEQAQGEEVDHRSDIFSFGVVLYELLTSKPPFRGEHHAALMYSIINEEPPPIARFNEKVTPEIERIVSRALAKDKEDRYQHADDLLAEFRHERKKLDYVRTGYITQPPASPPVTPLKRNLIKMGVAALLVFVLVALAVIFNPFNFEIGPKKAVASKQKSIAVLPFTNLGGKEEDEIFCNGMTDDVLTQLCKIADLSVISRTSIMRYKGTTKNMREIGTELGVGTILEGSIRRVGSRVRIDTKLIDAETDRNIWAENYDREMVDIFDVQSDVAKKIALALQATLTATEKKNIDAKPTENLDAYSYCVKGREYYYRYTVNDLKTAAELFRKAIALDTNYAQAYAGLSDVYSTGTVNFLLWKESMDDSAIHTAQKGIQKDPTCAEAYKALGLAYELKGWYTKAVEATRKAVELNSNYGAAISNLGDELIGQGKIIEGMPWRFKATRLDPLMAWRYLANGIVYNLLCDDENADKELNRAIELQPDLMLTYWIMINGYMDRGVSSEAFNIAEKMFAVSKDTGQYYVRLSSIHLWFRNYGKALEYLRLYERFLPSNETARRGFNSTLGFLKIKMEKKLDGERPLIDAISFSMQKIEKGNQSADYHYAISSFNAILGRKKEALQWLKSALDKSRYSYRSAANDPSFDDMRNDPEFIRLLKEAKEKVDVLREQVRALKRE